MRAVVGKDGADLIPDGGRTIRQRNSDHEVTLPRCLLKAIDELLLVAEGFSRSLEPRADALAMSTSVDGPESTGASCNRSAPASPPVQVIQV